MGCGADIRRISPARRAGRTIFSVIEIIASGHIDGCAQQSQNTKALRNSILAAGQHDVAGISMEPRSAPKAASLNSAAVGCIQNNLLRKNQSQFGVRLSRENSLMRKSLRFKENDSEI
tara:strand:- start:234 stop:587 length:354 start_codon:yes stop_codon:yes gene_type:complete